MPNFNLTRQQIDAVVAYLERSGLQPFPAVRVLATFVASSTCRAKILEIRTESEKLAKMPPDRAL